jgi:hypothetical protein
MLRYVPINAVPGRARVFAVSISFEDQSFVPWEEPVNTMLVAV